MVLTHHQLLIIIILSYTIIDIRAATTNPEIFLTLCGPNQSQNLVSFYVNFVSTTNLVYQNMSTTGFGAGVTGAPFPIYGLGQCFDYLSPLDCQRCYASSISVGTRCLPATGSRMYLDGCFLRYSDQNFFDEAVDKLDTSQCSNSTAVTSNSTLFTDSVDKFMRKLTLGAEKDRGYYKVGSVVASPGVTIYGMAQCWRSLNVSGCRDCLERGRESVGRCLPASDGKALNAGCFLRYSYLPFYLESTEEDSGHTGRRRLGAILGAISGALLVIVIVILWIRRSFTPVPIDVSGQEVSAELLKTLAASNLSFSYEDLKKATDNFDEKNKLGQGGFGAVYKGVLADGRVIAVKKLFFNARQRADQFFKEVNVISQVQHKNLVKLLGCSVEGPESLVVYEYLCNTSLEKFLYDTLKKNALTWKKRFDIIVGTAEGLGYLHSSSEVRIIHRDVKASNIMLDERFNPKIGDFGLARYFAEDQSHLSTGLAGTFGYMAPEYIIHGQLTEKADVYSYGILVIEIITGRKNQNSISTSPEGHSLMSMVWQHFNSECLIDLLDEQIQGQCSEEEALNIFHVALLCTQASPTLRPPMWKVVEMLNSRSMDLPPPTEPPFTNIKGADITIDASRYSENQMSISIIQGR